MCFPKSISVHVKNTIQLKKRGTLGQLLGMQGGRLEIMEFFQDNTQNLEVGGASDGHIRTHLSLNDGVVFREKKCDISFGNHISINLSLLVRLTLNPSGLFLLYLAHKIQSLYFTYKQLPPAEELYQMGHHVLHSVCFVRLALESNFGYHFLPEFSLDWMSIQTNGVCLN